MGAILGERVLTLLYHQYTSSPSSSDHSLSPALRSRAYLKNVTIMASKMSLCRVCFVDNWINGYGMGEYEVQVIVKYYPSSKQLPRYRSR